MEEQKAMIAEHIKEMDITSAHLAAIRV